MLARDESHAASWFCPTNAWLWLHLGAGPCKWRMQGARDGMQQDRHSAEGAPELCSVAAFWRWLRHAVYTHRCGAPMRCAASTARNGHSLCYCHSCTVTRSSATTMWGNGTDPRAVPLVRCSVAPTAVGHAHTAMCRETLHSHSRNTSTPQGITSMASGQRYTTPHSSPASLTVGREMPPRTPGW